LNNQKKRYQIDLTTDRTTRYARAVLDGVLIAGPYVRGACQRHLDDLEKAKSDWPYWYDCKEAAEAIDFFESNLFLNGGRYEGKPFLLFGWQDFIVGSIFGWKRKANGKRRFRVAYIETAKGSGKSPLCAGVGLKGLVSDGEARAEVYAAATYKDQAMVLFRDAIAFYDQSPELQKRLYASGTGVMRWKLEKTNNRGSFFRVISSEKKQSGPRPHMALLDEIHEHPDGAVIEMLRAGFKFREQPLSFMITNSGYDKTTVCWEYHENGAQVVLGVAENYELFVYICALDNEDLEDDRYLTDESVWIKVNPSLIDELPGYEYIRSQVNEARGIPSKLSTVKRLNFCVWTEAENPWISSEIWNPCRDDKFDESLLVGRRCYGGLDLSAVNDLTALALLFEPTENDPMFRLVVYFWLPGENLTRKAQIDHVPYDVWRDKGYVFVSKGAAISKTQVVKFLHEQSLRFDIIGVAFDRNRIKDFFEFAELAKVDVIEGVWDKKKKQWDFQNKVGIKMMPFGQEARSMAPAIDKFEDALLQKTVRHNGNPCLTWCASNAIVVADDADNRKLSKRKSTGRIDGVVAAVMAFGVSGSKDSGPSVYEERGIVML
jgi:phage terminase large subunit-like protein